MEASSHRWQQGPILQIAHATRQRSEDSKCTTKAAERRICFQNIGRAPESPMHGLRTGTRGTTSPLFCKNLRGDPGKNRNRSTLPLFLGADLGSERRVMLSPPRPHGTTFLVVGASESFRTEYVLIVPWPAQHVVYNGRFSLKPLLDATRFIPNRRYSSGRGNENSL